MPSPRLAASLLRRSSPSRRASSSSSAAASTSAAPLADARLLHARAASPPMSRRVSLIASHLACPPAGRAPAAMQAFGRPGGPRRDASSSSSAPSQAGVAVAREAATASTTGGGEDGSEPKVKQLAAGPVRTILLNRPKALNALDMDMILLIADALQTFSKTPAPVVLLRGVGRALCSGGDVMAVVKQAADEDPAVRQQALTFFKAEFELDYAIATLFRRTGKTFVSVMDGITMGGGVGLSVHAPIRIATEKTLFAMPETGIGYWPDVGVTRQLARLDGKVGFYLGITGARISGEEAYIAGLATHYIPSSLLAEALERLGSLGPDAKSDSVSNVLDEFSADPFSETEVAKGPQILAQSALLGSRRVALDHVFGQKSAEGIFAALEQLAAGAADSEAAAELRTRGAELDEGVVSWARTTLDALLTKSPRSIKVSLRAIAAARQLEDAEAFRLDMRLATAFCDLGAGRDFHTGVMHTLARDPETGKRRTGVAPWDVRSVADVSDQHISDLFFGDQQAARSAGMTMDVPRLAGLPPPNALSADEQRAQRNKTKGLPPLGWQVGHNMFALPAEAEIAALVSGYHPSSPPTQLEPEEVVAVLRSVKGDRRGLDGKVREFLQRSGAAFA